MKKSILLLLFLNSLNSFSKTISVKTGQVEKVNVFVKDSETGKLVKVGVTPLKSSYSDVSSNFAKSDNFMMVLKKEGYYPSRIMVSKLTSGTYEIEPNMESIGEKKYAKAYDKLINQLFDVQRLIRSKNYADALKKLDQLEKDYPESSSVYEMKAMAYYMSKDLNKSLSFYRKAASVNPENKEVYTMKKYLEKELNAGKKGN